jgi:hypothetical protein
LEIIEETENKNFIGPKGRDVSHPEGVRNSHRPLVVMLNAPSGRVTIIGPKGRDVAKLVTNHIASQRGS